MAINNVCIGLDTEMTCQSADKDLAEFYRLQAVRSKSEGKLNEAAENFNNAAKIDPFNPLHEVSLGMIYLLLRDAKNSIIHLKKALFLCPSNLNIKKILALNYVKMEKYAEAFELDKESQKTITMILERMSKYTGKCKMCGGCCKNMGLIFSSMKIASEEQFKEVCRKNPDFEMWIHTEQRTANLSLNANILIRTINAVITWAGSNCAKITRILQGRAQDAVYADIARHI
jgi:tetratricopeptide (TPR) repeat protein